jgi:antitoxin ParD1/3/4
MHAKYNMRRMNHSREYRAEDGTPTTRRRASPGRKWWVRSRCHFGDGAYVMAMARIFQQQVSIGDQPMTMHVNLSPEMEGFIKSKVSSGFYGNATEVIRDAIRRMQAEESRVSAWQAAIKKGDDQLDRGEGIAYTPETLNDITESAISATHSRQPIDSTGSHAPAWETDPDAPASRTPRR